jgi:hypothetical protein
MLIGAISFLVRRASGLWALYRFLIGSRIGNGSQPNVPLAISTTSL